MFPSSRNSNYQPFPCSIENQTHPLQLEKSFAITYRDDENPNSSHHHYNNYPPFLEDDGVILSYLLSQPHLLLGCTTSAPSGTTSTCQADHPAEISVVASNQDLEAVMDSHADKEITTISKTSNIDNGGASTKAAEVPARKRRTGKKDRHSKICTAQGPRDRRMRLSLPIARKFFDLQDMLGFDKASKTIEWLFSKSKTAIKELKQHLSPGLAQSSSTNKIFATSTANAKANNSFTTSTESSEVVSNTRPNVLKKKMMMMRKLCTVAKESRAEARARARERTKEKIRIRSSSLSGGGCFDDHKPNQTRSHHPHQVNPNDLCSTQQMTNCAANPTINHQLFGANSEEEDDEFPGFPGNWGINNSKMQSSSIFPYTTSTTSSTSNALQINPSSIFMTTQDQNPNSSFLNTASAQDQNPSTSSLFLHSYI